MKGTVVFFSAEKGWGFLKPSDGGTDLFCHWTSIIQESGYKKLADGDEVTFDIGTGPTGRPQAENVTKKANGHG